METIGVGKGTVTLDDFEWAQAIFVIGQNPGTNHPRMLTALERAKRNGCKLIHINPLPEAGMTNFKHPREVLAWVGNGTPLADLFLQVRINGDVPLLKGIMKEVLAAEEREPGAILDHDFIQRHTTGFNDFSRTLSEVSWEDIPRGCGVPRSE